MDEQLQKIIRDILLSYDDGVKSCVGVTRTGEMVWKGSFIAYMEMLRDALPQQST